MRARTMAVVAAVLALAGWVQADVFNLGGVRDPATGGWTGVASLETVPVGNPGNAGEWSGESYGGDGPDRKCGAVAYTYKIGKYEVTAGQYCVFLNAVAKTDSYGLYNPAMDYYANPLQRGCNILRSGSSGSYTYTVASDWANRPVNYVSWGDAARFANWLHNGQPTGQQNASTTEDGAYNLAATQSNYGPNGEVVHWSALQAALAAVTRKANWKWAINSEDEWYKAAYYKGGGQNAGYWDFPTGTNTAPGRNMADASGNNANYWTTGFLIASPYHRTPVGEFQKSDSPYGTFDQGGNVWEWDEANPNGGTGRGNRGGSYSIEDFCLVASCRGYGSVPTHEGDSIGFRVSQVPEPASMAILVLGGLAVLRRRR